MDLIIDEDLNKKLVVELTLPIILKSTNSVPMFKYIKNYKDKLPDNINKYKNKIQDISYFYTKRMKIDRKNGKKLLKESIPTLVARTGLDLALKQIAYIENEYLTTTDLKNFIKDYLTKHPNTLESGKCDEKAEIKRLIKMYDFLEYK